jgi:hypothetical protein
MAQRPMRPRRIDSHRALLAWSALLALAAVLAGTGLIGELTSSARPLLLAGPGLAPLEDHDGDGIPNIADDVYNGCDPTRADNDGDGFRDGFELATGSDPFDYYSRPTESSGVRVLIAPDEDDVYIVFLMASDTGFLRAGGQRILFVQHNSVGPVAFAAIDVTACFLERVHLIHSLSGQVKSWTIKVSRNDVGLWSLGFGMVDNGGRYCDGTVVHRRANDCIYAIRFPSQAVAETNLEPTEPETRAGTNPGQGFKECEQVSYAKQGSPLRHIATEQCETREQYICPPDCGALAGRVVVDLDNIWLY